MWHVSYKCKLEGLPKASFQKNSLDKVSGVNRPDSSRGKVLVYALSLFTYKGPKVLSDTILGQATLIEKLRLIRVALMFFKEVEVFPLGAEFQSQ